MKKSIRAFACWGLALLACAAGLYADTIPGGNVSGTWTAAGSPYLIMGDITVPADSTLTIEPGVEVNFQGFYMFTVNGYLQAVGTVTDSIRFFPANTTNGWNTMRFANAPDSSHLAYCTISYSGNTIFGMGGINCTNSNPVITHCRIIDNGARDSYPNIAGGIALNNSHADISWCDISNNNKPDFGGGINITNSNPVITGCNISGNECYQQGGGIYITGNSSPIITNSTVEQNKSNMYGGGVSVPGGNITFSECTLGYNIAYDGGGGISISGGNISLDRCIIEHNSLIPFSGQGGGIFANGDTLVVDHCIFYGNYLENYGNYGMDIHTGGSVAMTVSNSIFYNDFLLIVFGSTSPASVSYNDFLNHDALPFIGNTPAGLGQLTTTNANGDSCDVYSNIFLDPLFVGGDDYHLTNGSPCIDAGDPAFACDPDSTVTDMGAYWFDQRTPSAALSDTVLDFGVVTVGGQADLGLVVYNLGTANLMIGGLANSLPVFTTDYNPADSLIPPGDSLSLTVTFAPADTFPVCDTLIIANNDHSLAVALSGVGLPTGVAGPSTPLGIPATFGLRLCKPNPARGSTSIEYQLPKECRVELEIYNITGQLVKRFDEGRREAGCHSVTWNTAHQPAGVYFYRLKAGSFAATKKMVVIR